MNFFSWRVLACASACLWVHGADAQSTSGAIAPPFPQLFREVESSAPRLRMLDAAVDAAHGHARQAAAWVNPVAGVEVEDVAGSGPYHGSSQAQTTFSLSEPLELGGQRGARIALGRAGVRSAEAQRVQARIELAFDMALAYAEAEAAQARTAVLTDDVSRAREDVRSAHALVTAGKDSDLRALQADASAATAEAELSAARAELVGALARLASLAGSGESYSAVTPSLLIRASSASSITTEQRAPLDSPAVRSAIAERDVAGSRVVVEEKRGIPTPSLSVGMRRFQGEDSTAWVFGIAVPLPLFDRNRGEIAAARAELREAQERENATRVETQAAYQAVVAQMQAAESRRTAADQAEAAAREAYRLARIGYEAGRSPLIELLSTRRMLTEAQSRALDARVARVATEASLARLAGRLPFVE